MKAARREKEQRMVLVVANKPEQFENKFPWILDNTHEQLNETTSNQYFFLILYVGGLHDKSVLVYQSRKPTCMVSEIIEIDGRKLSIFLC